MSREIANRVLEEYEEVKVAIRRFERALKDLAKDIEKSFKEELKILDVKVERILEIPQIIIYVDGPIDDITYKSLNLLEKRYGNLSIINFISFRSV